MKNIIVFFILMFFKSNIYGQDLKNSTNKIQLGFNYSTDYNYRILTINKENNGSKIYRDFKNKYETAKYGYTIGILVSYAINSKIALTTGLQYSNKGYQINKSKEVAIFESDLLNPTNISPHSIYSYYYLDIPLCLSYFIGNKRLQLLMSIGLTANLFITDKISRKRYNESNASDLQLYFPAYESNKLNVSPIISCGMNYRIHSKIDIRLEPTFRHQLFNTRNTDLSAHFWNIGLNTGIYYSF